ncbi:LolA family protein [Niabella ginsengisoli]|uniref:Outer membrane lipoprotein carrier protein LolA n=1 Tax=Niabella ginsengisoli TaxID=522298 RepID=A0ABS9SL85_9BACT|nr:outer membrane lipoprotein carrier protein LolA [Niabella ginsengisoli]MCH5599146.1 outer membrane lipoprotein carrier protein LolA [Niabella ginsengisoli]
MKKLYVTGAILLMSVISFAQQKDPKAKAILDQVSAKFKTYKTVSANFAYQIANSAGKALSSKSGTVQMKGNKYAINLGSNKIISDGVTIWNYDPASKEVTVSSASASEGTITPQKLFTDFYNKDFMYVMDKDGKVGGKEVNKIIMQPIDKNKPFARVYVAVDKATKNIISTTVVEKSGNRYVYNVSNFKPNVAISDANFTFDKAKYPGVEVVDLR